jgi:sugar (pentulose or hexulose) kinase
MFKCMSNVTVRNHFSTISILIVCRGHKVRSVTVCGGLTVSPLYLQTQADVLGLPLLLPEVSSEGFKILRNLRFTKYEKVYFY